MTLLGLCVGLTDTLLGSTDFEMLGDNDGFLEGDWYGGVLGFMVMPDSPDLLPLSPLNEIDECLRLLLMICTLAGLLLLLLLLLELLLLGESSRFLFFSLLSMSFLSRRSFLSLYLSSPDFKTGVTVIDDGMEMGVLLPGMGMISMPGLFSSAALRDAEELWLLLLLLDFLLEPSVSVRSSTMGDLRES